MRNLKRAPLPGDENAQLLLISGVVLTLSLFVMATISATTENVVNQTSTSLSASYVTDFITIKEQLRYSYQREVNARYSSVYALSGTINEVLSSMERTWNSVLNRRYLDITLEEVATVHLSRDISSGRDGTEVVKVTGISGFTKNIGSGTGRTYIGPYPVTHDSRPIRGGGFDSLPLVSNEDMASGSYDLILQEHTFSDAVEIDSSLSDSYKPREKVCSLVDVGMDAKDSTFEERTTLCTVINAPPTFDIYVEKQDYVVTASLFSFEDDGDADSLYTLVWDMGDGTRITVRDVSQGSADVRTHAYLEKGTYVVTLSVIDPLGGVGTSWDSVKVP